MRPAATQRIALEGGGLLLFEDALADESARLFDRLMAEAAWEQHWLRLFGRRIAAPRLSAWHAEPGCDYRYSGLSLVARPFSPVLREIRERVEALAGQTFNSVLLNLYRDGNDSMSWHSDDEAELGAAPVIASVSLGATRRFLLRHRDDSRRRVALDLPNGSLLLMESPLQSHWQHSIPKTRRPVTPRINLTWRRVVPVQQRAGANPVSR